MGMYVCIYGEILKLQFISAIGSHSHWFDSKQPDETRTLLTYAADGLSGSQTLTFTGDPIKEIDFRCTLQFVVMTLTGGALIIKWR